MKSPLWHNLTLPQVFETLKTQRNGLTQKEAAKRLKKFGFNVLPEEKRLSGLGIFLSQFKSPLVYILLAAAVISLYLQNFIDLAVILAAVFVSVILGFVQEYKAEQAITRLKRMVDFKTRVWRDGNEIEINVKDLVIGDIIILGAGDKVPADCRLLAAENLYVIEAALTGESIPSQKSLKILPEETVLADRENMVYLGTIVAEGKGQAIVCEIGTATEFGKIAKSLKEIPKEKTPLQQQLTDFSRVLSLIVLIVCFSILLLGVLQGRPILGRGLAAREGMLNIAAALAVAAIPEGLIVAVTAILALGMQAILKKKALIRRLVAAETLGATSVICTDKTGTITEGKMQVSQIITYQNEIDFRKFFKYQADGNLTDHDLLLEIAILCNDAIIENPQQELESFKFLGNPTEQALLLGAISAGINKKQLELAQPRIAEIPFDSAKKFMATRNQFSENKEIIYVKGAPEKVLEMCSKLRISGREEKLTPWSLKNLKNKYENLSKGGLRVLGFAYRQMPAKEIKELAAELKELVFVGFIGLKDPLRPEAKITFQECLRAGIKPVIITGDHKLTAKTIVSELGLKVKEENILEGKELDKITDKELQEKVKEIDIYARVEPQHKLRIVDAWQARGEVVAMTGDGVNDAPAIKSADIGIALGSGTDVAKETADMILLDNNFKTIVAAIKQGRIIFENIKKVILYLLVDSFSEIILIIGALFLKLPLPLLPAQILWINLVTDGLPNLALTFEPGEKEVMNEPPRKKNQPLLDKEMKVLIFLIGIITDVVLLGFFYLLLKSQLSINYIRTIIFTALAIDSLFYVFSCRSFRYSIFSKNLFTNRYLILAVLGGFFIQLAAIYLPFFQKIFETVALDWAEWSIILFLAILKIVAIEATKYIFIIRRVKNFALRY